MMVVVQKEADHPQKRPILKVVVQQMCHYHHLMRKKTGIARRISAVAECGFRAENGFRTRGCAASVPAQVDTPGCSRSLPQRG